MKIEEFKKSISRSLNKSLSGRHLYVWNGKIDKLISFIENHNTIHKLNVEEIVINLQNNLSDEKEIKKATLKELEKELDLWYQSSKNILIINSIFLLIRYAISTNIFYNYLSDNKIIILAIPIYNYPGKLPDYLNYNSKYILDKITEVIGKDKILEEEE